MSTVEMELLSPSGLPTGAPTDPLVGGMRRWVGSVNRRLNEHRVFVLAVAMMGIGLISAYDFYLTIATLACLPELEANPLARKIMGLDGNHIEQSRIAAFLGLKFAGNVVVLVALGVLGMLRHQRAIPVALGVLLFQCYLMYELCRPALMTP